MDLYDVAIGQLADQDETLNALASRILPLPRGIQPSTVFMKQTRKMLLNLKVQPATKVA